MCVSIYPETLPHLLSKSPLLKIVTGKFSLQFYTHWFYSLSEYYKLLQYLFDTLPLLLDCLRLVEHLTIGSEWIDTCVIVEAVPQKLPTPLVHLKYMSVDLCLISDHGLSLLAVLIKSSPNLEKINLEAVFLEISYILRQTPLNWRIILIFG